MGTREVATRFQRFAKFVHRISAYACWVGTGMVCILMLLTTADVTSRSLFDMPVTGTYEVSAYMLVIIVCLSFAYAEQANTMVRIEFLTNRFSPRVQAALFAVFRAMEIFLIALVAWQSYVGSLNSAAVNSVSDSLRIPVYPFRFVVGIGAFLFILELVVKLIDNIVSVTTGVLRKAEAGKEVAGLN
jgi:TRAP-type transport system small permease protein